MNNVFLLTGKGECDVSSTESEVFTAIVSMCTSRILNRLGLIPGRKRSRKSVKDSLSEAIDYTRRLDNGKNPHTRTVVMSFVTAAKELIKLINFWCNHQTTARLANLVEGIHRLYQQQTIHETLRQISNKDMDPSTRRSLENMISKVARYRQAARFLFRTAKNFPIVRRARVETVVLPQDAFQHFSFDECEPQLLPTMLRIAPNMNANNLSQIWHLLQTTETEATGRFSQQTKDTLQQAKIHAEIQLIFHCELQRLRKFPRVIASSKDACYLCNAFLSMHGTAHAPRCHGRLYPGWRLPFIPHLSNLERRFNCYIETVIKDTLNTMFSRQKRIMFPFPQESTLLTLPTSVSTLESIVPGLSPLSRRSENIPSEDSHSSSVGSLVHGNQGHRLDIDSSVSIVDISATEDIIRSDDLSSKGSSDSDVLPVDLLCPGTSLTRQMKSISPLYAAGSLEVQIECDGRSRSVKSPANGLVYTIEWLTTEAVKKFGRKCHSRCVIDVESLNGEASHVMCNENTLYIATCDSVIRLRFTPRQDA